MLLSNKVCHSQKDLSLLQKAGAYFIDILASNIFLYDKKVRSKVIRWTQHVERLNLADVMFDYNKAVYMLLLKSLQARVKLTEVNWRILPWCPSIIELYITWPHNIPRQEDFSGQFLVEHRNGDTPHPLTRDAPVRPAVKLGQHALTRGGRSDGDVTQTRL